MKLTGTARNLPMAPFRQHFAEKASERKLFIHPCHDLDRYEGSTVGEVTDKLDLQAGTRLSRISQGLGGAALKTAGVLGLAAGAAALMASAPLAVGLGAVGAALVVGGDQFLKESGQRGISADASKALKAEANRRAAGL